VKSWERDLETHLTVLGRFVDLVGLPADDATLLKRELERYVRVRIARELWMHPDITRFHTEWYREFYRILDVEDPYRELKDRSMRAARDLLRSLELPTLRDAVLACVVANLLDYGAPDLRESLSLEDFAHLDRMPLFVDDFDRLADALGRIPERERHILALYYEQELTLSEIGRVIGVGESRVSQLRTQAIARLRSMMHEWLQVPKVY
jgi:RNA polymerase sigma factor (sigma-70 family)